MNITFEVRLNRFQSLAGRLPGVKPRIQDDVGRRIVATAKGRAKVDTGQMRDGTVYQGGGVAAATANHSGFLDMGTRYIPADRWFSGAAEQEGASLAKTAGAAVREALGG